MCDYTLGIGQGGGGGELRATCGLIGSTRLTSKQKQTNKSHSRSRAAISILSLRLVHVYFQHAGSPP